MAYAYSTLDADSATIDIQPGQGFSTFWVAEDGQTRAEEYAHPWNVLDLWSDEEFSAFCVVRTEVPDPPTPIPEVVSAMQLKRHLRTMARTDAGLGTLRTQVDALVAGSGDGDLQDYWAYTSQFHRDHPKVAMMIAALGLTSDQADAAWLAASLLS